MTIRKMWEKIASYTRIIINNSETICINSWDFKDVDDFGKQ